MAPQSHPRAQFVPISPDLNLSGLVESTDNFDYVTRLPHETLKEHSIQSLEQLVLRHVVIGGKPLVIEGWEETIDPYLFSSEWLQNNLGKKAEQVRDIPNEVNIPMTMGHYLKSMNQLADQFTPNNYRDPKRQRLYLKDIDCPDEWARNLKGFIPEIFYYMNECIESRTGGDGAILEPNEYGQMRYGKGVAPAGDLMSSLPKEMQALNMMCYIGHEGTFTPTHREMCASLGHNIMVDTSSDGKFEKAGSSIWFMTETKEREVVSEYFLSMLGHDIEVEKHFAQINAWKKAPFNVWVVEQKVGDLILIPPLAPHQVWNRGTRTMKAAWNRTTVDTLELAINEALPRARMVCREEQYKNKAIIYYTLVKYHALVTRATVEQKMWKYGRIKQLFEDFKRLFALFTDIIVSEMFSAALPTENNVEFLEYDSNVTCSYCRCNIWNRFLTCKTCIETSPGGEEDTYDVCMDCYAMGRSCGCISNLKWVEQWEWSSLAQNYEAWRNTVVQYDGYFNIQTSPQPLEVARKRFGKKPVAQICQEQLQLRPWQDIKNPVPRTPSPGMSSDEPDVDDEGRIKKKKGKKVTRGRTAAKKGKTHACHVCCHHHENWRMAFCTTCSMGYCYGVLWRAFDLMPQEVMEDRDWSCPKCRKICSCGKCRKSPDQVSYAPKGTLLGHDTRKVADFRSVESLVDFSKTNLGWLRGDNDDHPQESSRMKKLREKAEVDKSREDEIDEKYLIDEEGAQPGDDQSEPSGYPRVDNMDDIDPQLRGLVSSMPQANGNSNNHFQDPYAPVMSEINGVDREQMDGDGGENFGWLDGHYDLEYIDAFNRGVGYPSRLLAPEAPMVAQSPAADPDPTEAEKEIVESNPEPHPGQARMMGIGYYHQTGGDRIVYEPPSLDERKDETVALASVATNPNFALSDLLPPEAPIPKKRKLGHRSDDEDDVEFFTSKKARKLAASKSHSEMGKLEPNADDEDKSASVPRRSVPQPKTYIELGEESLPFTADDMVPAISNNRAPRKSGGERLSGSRKKSGRTSSVAPPSTTPPPAKAPRQSAWLARKEAEERGEVLPTEVKRARPRGLHAKNSMTSIDGTSDEDSDDPFADEPPRRGRGRPRLSAKAKTKSRTTIDISSDEDSDDDDHDHSNIAFNGSLADKSIKWRVSKKNPKVQVAGLPRDSDVEELLVPKPPPKRRGRPPKNASATQTPVGTPKLLSLKEKLASKGKAFKIVARKPRESIESPQVTPAAPTARSTPSIVNPPRSVADSTPLFTGKETGEASMNNTTTIIRKDTPEMGLEAPQAVKRSSSTTSIVKAAMPPVKKGPTVVRLESPSDDSSASERSPSRGLPSSDDEDESIPAVRPSSKLVRGAGSLRGRGFTNGNGSGMARRGRPRKSY
ncbi:C-module-binding factor A [Hyphodiscus hymeniophilus]|uniref:C-module-binding factor A n=1 Tax=Hyphodiscus hymeniophilus TaxID=353542 RepID=A0A9P6VS42_9HELO|nr:C-module-binding factor A [Hyphodiscus hymeniophilus]